jgi:hypothetical protein
MIRREGDRIECIDFAEDLEGGPIIYSPGPPPRRFAAKLLTIFIRCLAYIAMLGAYAAIISLAWYAYTMLGWWSILVAVVLFPFMMMIINIITFPANALATWANLRDLK